MASTTTSMPIDDAQARLDTLLARDPVSADAVFVLLRALLADPPVPSAAAVSDALERVQDVVGG